jgi:PDZ domain-containing protein
MVAAERAGADLFLVPDGNCEEAEGFVPQGLAAVSVANFEEAILAIENLNAGKTFPALSCKN